MLKRTTVSERAAARVEAIAQRDADSWWALTNAQELYASTEARASAIIKQEEHLAVRAC
jgi:hypothetical protein